MIILTGSSGFIGSCMLSALNEKGYTDIVLVDDFSRVDKLLNYQGKKFREKIERLQFFSWVKKQNPQISAIIHLGARTDTTSYDYALFDQLNLHFSQQVWELASKRDIPLIYASSAATYGDGSLGFQDTHEIISELKPLNPYGESKHQFDRWALAQTERPSKWFGLKFFNVYGPNEYHKGRMASVALHAFRQILEHSVLRLFRSHRADYQDGEQLRDFVYVKDITTVMMFLLENAIESGIYNLGTGQASTFNELAQSIFEAMDRIPQIQYIDTPADIREAYQYFTQADMKKLILAGYSQAFYTINDGISDYVKHYLIEKKYY